MGKKWTQEERVILEFYYPQIGILAHLFLPDRAWGAVKNRAWRWGIKRVSGRSPDEPGKAWNNPLGYIFLWWTDHPLATDGKILEHRLVYWQKSGYCPRVLDALLNGATIHHLNGIRDDNRPENLEIRYPGNHPQGVSIRDIVRAHPEKVMEEMIAWAAL